MRHLKTWTVWPPILLALNAGLFFLSDGLRVLLTGDYLRIDGQLGPWADLVRGLGLDPMGFGPAFVLLGLAWLTAGALLVFRVHWGWPALVVVSLASLWYLMVGTINALLVLTCLFARPTRRAAGWLIPDSPRENA